MVLDAALVALIERQLEQSWAAAHAGDDVPVDVPIDLSEVPWDDG